MTIVPRLSVPLHYKRHKSIICYAVLSIQMRNLSLRLYNSFVMDGHIFDLIICGEISPWTENEVMST